MLVSQPSAKIDNHLDFPKIIFSFKILYALRINIFIKIYMFHGKLHNHMLPDTCTAVILTDATTQSLTATYNK